MDDYAAKRGIQGSTGGVRWRAHMWVHGKARMYGKYPIDLLKS